MATTTTIDRQVLDLEKRFWEAMKSQDARTIESLTAPGYTMIMEEGVSSSSPKELAQMLTNSDDFRLKSFQLDEKNVTTAKISDDVSVVAYPVHSEFDRNGKLEKRDAFALSVWKRDGNTWRVFAGADTPARAPR